MWSLKRGLSVAVAVALTAVCCSRPMVFGGEALLAFPDARPERGSFARPRDGEQLAINPPGFCWWRAASRGAVQYRLIVRLATGEPCYVSPLLDDPVHVPDREFPPGRYDWTVEAVNAEGQVACRQDVKSFEIQHGAYPQPWTAPRELLARARGEHPRLLFPAAVLEPVRQSLADSRQEAFASLQAEADAGLRLDVPAEPDYDKLDDPAQQRLGYVDSYRAMRRYHQGAMLHMALMYLMTGRREYGEHSKALLLGAAAWDPEGVSSIMSRYGDEVGLGLAKSAALTYDWIYDLLSPAERDRVRGMLIARGDQMLRRLERLDFLARPESSHDGRLPGYLIEHAIALAEEPRAEVWLDYALRAVMTVFPHWAGSDGGWAEGLAYGSAYNSIFITPLESLRQATGMDIWRRPFFAKLPYFFVYNAVPLGEIKGFGDSYDGSVPGSAAGLRGLIQFHAERLQDPTLNWWAGLLRDEQGRRPQLPPLPGLILPQQAAPQPPSNLPSDAAFYGVGWAALHSDLQHPERDLFVAFKSSPYGSVSHSYADQNSFSILFGGRALARPGGVRYPQHGAPFHTEYTQQTVAQTSILINGQGQRNRDASANGRLTAFQTRDRFAYVCGAADDAYGQPLQRFRRHVLLIRPSVVCVVDDLQAEQPANFQWLLHAPEPLVLDEASQTFVSHRGGASMRVRLLTAGGFAFEQDNQWPVDPKKGFPTASAREPEKIWHFQASTQQKATARRIAAVMVVGDAGQSTPAKLEVDQQAQRALVSVDFADGQTTATIQLDAADAISPLIKVVSRAGDGAADTLEIAAERSAAER